MPIRQPHRSSTKLLLAISAITALLAPIHGTAQSGLWSDLKKIRLGQMQTDSMVANPIRDAEPLRCAEPTARVDANGGESLWYSCQTSAHNPNYSPHDVSYPLIYITPRGQTFNERNPSRIRISLHDATPDTHADHVKRIATPGANIVDIYPREQAWQGHAGGQWLYSGNETGKPANYNGEQIAAGVDSVLRAHAGKIDLAAGIHIRGSGQGATGALHQALILPRYQSNIAIVETENGLMRVAKNHRNAVRDSGGEGFLDEVDFSRQRRKAQHMHFHWTGTSNSKGFDPGFIDWCEQYRVSCSLVWYGNSIVPKDEKWQRFAALWETPDQDATLDRILPVITNSSANHRSHTAGYYNRGIHWRHDAIADTKTGIRIPLRYRANKQLGAGLPDQPDSVTFSVTPRHVRHFPLKANAKVTWTFGDQQGSATVDSDGVLTIEGLRLENGSNYINLDIAKVETNSAPIPPGDAKLQHAIVYTRVPRTTGEHAVTLKSGELYRSDKWDYMDTLPEVARIYNRFNAPGQLVIRNIDGNEKIIYDCMNQSRPCVPLDPMPSLDGRKIAFSVYSADNLIKPWPPERNFPNRQLGSNNIKAQIFIYDIDTQTLEAWPHEGNTKDISPIWLPNDLMMFASSRHPSYPPRMPGINPHPTQPRLFIANIDGSNVRDISPHEVTGAIHPFLMTNGRVAYSSHWTSHNLAYVSNNGGINWPGTVSNFWNIMETDRRGGDFAALLGAHKTRLPGSNPKSNTIKALHFLAQRANDDLCTVNYYRANNLGLGDVLCWPLEQQGIEGPAPGFIPRNLYSVARWSTSNDRGSLKNSDNRYMGKVGWPEGTSDNQLILSVGRGLCTQVATSVPRTTQSLADDIGCDVGLYKTTRIPSEQMDDLAYIVNLPQWHEFGAREIRARDIATPELSNTMDGSCVTASADAGTTDAHNYRGYKFNKNYSSTANNGSEIYGLDHSEMVGLRFYKLLPLAGGKDNPKNSIGNRVELLGDVPLLADNSFTVQLPCETPYLMAGIDKDGRVIKRDQVPQSLRTGEKRVCSGCHLHSKKGRPYEKSIAFHSKPVALTTPHRVPTYERDIRPLLERRCGQCHSDDVPISDYDKLVWDYFQEYVPDDRKLQVSSSSNLRRRFGLQRPYSSKYVNTMYARESLLYWKAANRRTDGREDSLYSNDIDFGKDHPTSMSANELKLLGDWLDSGATR